MDKRHGWTVEQWSNEVDACQKNIEEAFRKAAVQGEGTVSLSDALKAWLPESRGPGQLFGINREANPPRLADYPKHPGGRQPAFPKAKQHKVLVSTRYRVYSDYMADEMLVLALDADDSIRVCRVSGEVWKIGCENTNAPEGERALSDDDLETILVECEGSSTYWGELLAACPCGSEHDDPEEATKLERDLFDTDPDVVAHVKAQMDVNPSVPILEFSDTAMAFETGLSIAYVRATEGKEPEAAWLARATKRMRAILNRR